MSIPARDTRASEDPALHAARASSAARGGRSSGPKAMLRSVSPTERSVAMASPVARVLDVVELTKPRITFMVVVTTAAGYLLGAAHGAHLIELLHTMLGTALVAAGASALNQLLERDTDARMERTRNRPLPAGRLEPVTVLAIGGGLGLLGTVYLAAVVNELTAGLAALTLGLYVLAYTPLKRVSSLCTIVGAIP
ncbi:MAG: protoheme IX farnesyltransferase, partial [Deltaproteobacteria bacterium]|nr:protoheme IX farnesyltransferase [Deltaproteobacteria bacterium]